MFAIVLFSKMDPPSGKAKSHYGIPDSPVQSTFDKRDNFKREKHISGKCYVRSVSSQAECLQL
jgi:hypothetical protein